MIIQKVTRVFIEPDDEFYDYTELLRDDKWHRTLMSNTLAIFEKYERIFDVSIDDLTKKEQ